LAQLVAKYPDVLTPKLRLTHLTEYTLQLKDNKPVRLASYRLATPKMKFLMGHLEQLLSDDVIEDSTSCYSSPMFLVPRSGSSFRAVVDYRALNKNIEIESVPLPDIHSAFHWFAKARYFTTLDFLYRL
jgi:hypothetical protein